jgi:4'-phosphopantetheinyl transferase
MRGLDGAQTSEPIAHFTDEAAEIVVSGLDVAPQSVRTLSACLSADERQRAERFMFDRDRDRFIVARARLRQLLAARLDVRPESVELVYGHHGKPALGGRFADSGWRFNVSHSGQFAVHALSRSREIGVDIEAVRALRDSDDIAARFFSPRENAAYQALDPRDKPIGFFNCWTRKEAFIKALGDGLYHPLDRFDVSLTPGEPARILRVGDTPGEACGWRLESFFPAPGFVAALVTGMANATCATVV